jgi:hypothetical protein
MSDSPSRFGRRIAFPLAFLLAVSGALILRIPRETPNLWVLPLFVAAGALVAISARPPEPWPALPPARPVSKSSRWLTLAGVLLAVVAVALFVRGRQTPTQFSGFPLALWLLALGLFVAGTWERAGPPAGGAPERKTSRLERALLAVVFLTALFLRVKDIDSFPNGCQSDEGQNGLAAVAAVEGHPYFPYAETNEGQATLFTYLIAVAFKLFGSGVTQMRLVSAVVGTGTIVAFWFLARDHAGPAPALAATALFSVARWHLTFSRIVYELILTPLAEILLFFFLLRALRDGRRRDWALAGLALAFGLNTYTAFRVVPFLVLVFLGGWVVFHRDRARRDVAGSVVFLGGAFVGTAPLLVYVVQHWSVFMGRTRRISVWNDIGQAGGSLAPLVSNLKKTLWSFHFRGDGAGLNNLPGEPLLDVVTGAFLVLGLAYALRYARRALPFLCLAAFVVNGSAAVLSVAHEAPTARRPIALLPVIFLLVALVVDRAQGFGGRAPGPLLSSALGAVVLLAGALNVRTFFGRQEKDVQVWRAYSFVEAAVGTFLRDLPADARVFMTPGFNQHSAITLISKKRPYEVLNLSEPVPLREEAPAGDSIFILETTEGQAAALLQRLYPKGVLDRHKDPWGEPVFLSFRIPLSAVAQTRGLLGRYFTGDSPGGMPRAQRADTHLDFDWTKSPPPVSPPFNARWEGSLLARRGQGTYVFEVESDGAAELWIDDRLVLRHGAGVRKTSKSVDLVGGFHPITLVYRSGPRPAGLDLHWGELGSAPVPIPASALCTLDLGRNGLVGYYYPNGEAEGPPTVVQRDIFILPNNVLPEPFSIVWKGKLAVPSTGMYLLALQADDGALLFVDGRKIVDNGGSHGSEYRETAVNLEAGFHELELRYWQLGGSKDMQLSWRPPNGPHQPIPPAYLFPIEGPMPKGVVVPPPSFELQDAP